MEAPRCRYLLILIGTSVQILNCEYIFSRQYPRSAVLDLMNEASQCGSDIRNMISSAYLKYLNIFHMSWFGS